MSYLEQEFHDDLHPIDMVESVAARREWRFDRLADDQIAMSVEGQWRRYALTLHWDEREEMLRLICTFEMDPPEETLPALHDVLNRTNDACWSGNFSYWREQRLMVHRYGLLLAGGQMAGPEQIDTMIRAAVATCERYFPAFQLVSWGGQQPEEAMQIAMADARGHA